MMALRSVTRSLEHDLPIAAQVTAQADEGQRVLRPDAKKDPRRLAKAPYHGERVVVL